jgi:alginate O-acetyltransferase complex protein AlgI
MVFSSIEFLWFFMPLVLGLYLLLPPRARNALLAAFSLLFFVWGAHALLFLFLASIAFNFGAGLLIEAQRNRGEEHRARWVMRAAVAVNLLCLVFWKYAAFGVHQVDALSRALGLGRLGVPSITLPLGISFFTFHGISYVVDVFRGTARPMRSVANYGQYMAFFAQLIAGPIVRYHEIDEQIRHPPPRSQRTQDIADGFPRFALGLTKKAVIADPVGAVANAAFGAGGHPSFGTAWVGALAYTVQIYFDFSGYSDMAIGMARMFGLHFPENFARPYSAVSMTDFWRRWHMTLSRWFRDYLYIPLGGSRGAQGSTVRNLWVVFFFTGAWHGAAWTFIIWGLFHGTLLVTERVTGIASLDDRRAQFARRAVTFLLVVVGWVMFRSKSVGQAFHFYSAMLPHGHPSLSLGYDVSYQLTTQAKLALALGLLTVLWPRDFVLGRVVQGRWSGAPLLARVLAVASLPYTTLLVAAGSFSPFLYFRF